MTTPDPFVTEDRPARLLTEGRVRLSRVTLSTALATVTDGHHTHRVIANPGAWGCSCAVIGRCVHIDAVALVTTIPQP